MRSIPVFAWRGLAPPSHHIQPSSLAKRLSSIISFIYCFASPKWLQGGREERLGFWAGTLASNRCFNMKLGFQGPARLRPEMTALDFDALPSASSTQRGMMPGRGYHVPPGAATSGRLIPLGLLGTVVLGIVKAHERPAPFKGEPALGWQVRASPWILISLWPGAGELLAGGWR
jgi:hypothetical protein